MKVIVIIPARMDSHRFPGKPLANNEKTGFSLLHYTYSAARRLTRYVIVTSNDREILNYCRDNDWMWRPSRADHENGTLRVEEVVRQMNPASEPDDIIINWQVDEPCVRPEDVKLMVDHFPRHEGISTLVSTFPRNEDWFDTNLVKVALTVGGTNCLYFSRCALPASMYHIGVYAFRPSALGSIAKMTPTDAAREESLEQLTWIQYGFRIVPTEVVEAPLSINTQEDWRKFCEIVE